MKMIKSGHQKSGTKVPTLGAAQHEKAMSAASFRHLSAYKYMKLDIKQLLRSREENKDGKQAERTGPERIESE